MSNKDVITADIYAYPYVHAHVHAHTYAYTYVYDCAYSNASARIMLTLILVGRTGDPYICRTPLLEISSVPRTSGVPAS